MKDTRKIVGTAIFIAFIYVATLMIQIPIPGTNGYVNIGDSFILLAGLYLGPIGGLVAGGMGSALTDLTTGYAIWAPFTLVIKGLMGYLMGSFVNKKLNRILTVGLIEIFMVLGYFIAGTILTGNSLVALASVPANTIQGILGIVLYFILDKALEKTKLKKALK